MPGWHWHVGYGPKGVMPYASISNGKIRCEAIAATVPLALLTTLPQDIHRLHVGAGVDVAICLKSEGILSRQYAKGSIIHLDRAPPRVGPCYCASSGPNIVCPFLAIRRPNEGCVSESALRG